MAAASEASKPNAHSQRAEPPRASRPAECPSHPPQAASMGSPCQAKTQEEAPQIAPAEGPLQTPARLRVRRPQEQRHFSALGDSQQCGPVGIRGVTELEAASRRASQRFRSHQSTRSSRRRSARRSARAACLPARFVPASPALKLVTQARTSCTKGVTVRERRRTKTTLHDVAERVGEVAAIRHSAKASETHEMIDRTNTYAIIEVVSYAAAMNYSSFRASASSIAETS